MPFSVPFWLLLPSSPPSQSCRMDMRDPTLPYSDGAISDAASSAAQCWLYPPELMECMAGSMGRGAAAEWCDWPSALTGVPHCRGQEGKLDNSNSQDTTEKLYGYCSMAVKPDTVRMYCSAALRYSPASCMEFPYACACSLVCSQTFRHVNSTVCNLSCSSSWRCIACCCLLC